MAKIVYNAEVMRVISFFEQMTGAHVKDCVMNDRVLFIVHEGEVAKAVGKGGKHVRNVEHKLKKRVRVVEFNSNAEVFMENLVAPLKLAKMEWVDSKLVLTAKDLKTRGLLIGRNAANLRLYEEIMQRYFAIEELRVV